MSDRTGSRQTQQVNWRELLRRILKATGNNWQLKLVSLLVAVAIWGGLISEDAALTREKTFSDVPVTVTGTDTLLRNGLIVVSGLKDLPAVKIRADVPQKSYENALPTSYSVRVDVSRITEPGEQKLPILTSASTTYGSVSWISVSEVTVTADQYITRRRLPVIIEQTGSLPAGYYAPPASVDPGNVVVSGPRTLVENIAQVAAGYNLSQIKPQQGLQYVAAPFRLLSADGSEISREQISVTSENVLLDTLLIEQKVYPMKKVGINLTGIVKGSAAEGFQVTGVFTDPAELMLAGNLEDIDEIRMLDLSSVIDVGEQRDTLIRALRVEKPAGAVYLSESVIYVTVEIKPVPPASGRVR